MYGATGVIQLISYQANVKKIGGFK